MTRALATTILFACGCTHHPQTPEVRPAPAAKAPPAAATAPALELTLAVPPEPVQVSILQPATEQTLDLADAGATPISVHSARPDWLLELALDGRRARPLASLPEQPTLADLSEGAVLLAGAHYLVAALRADELAPARFAVARFSVQTGEKDSEPLIYCGRPSGTYWGAGTGLLLDFVSDGFELGASGAVRVRARSQDTKVPAREALLRDGNPRIVHGIGAGDWSIELDLLGPGDRPLQGRLSRHRCELTLNEGAAP